MSGAYQALTNRDLLIQISDYNPISNTRNNTDMLIKCISFDRIGALTKYIDNCTPICVGDHNIKKLLKAAAAVGNLPALIILDRTFVAKNAEWCWIWADVSKVADKYNQLSVIKWLFSKGCKFGLNPWNIAITIDVAAAQGHLDIIIWLNENIVLPNGNDVHSAATIKGVNSAAENGHLQVVKWLYANYSICCTINGINGAARNGHLHILEWLHQNKSTGWTINAMDIAAGSGHLDVVKWLHRNRTEGCSQRAMHWAARSGHLSVVKWLYKHKVKRYSCRTPLSAIHSGNLGMLEWMATTNLPMRGLASNEAVRFAAEKGSIDILKWLHRNGYIKNINTKQGIIYAVINGHLTTAQWLYRKGYSTPSSQAVSYAARIGRVDIIRWLLSVMDDKSCGTDVMDYAALNGHLETIKWLSANTMFAPSKHAIMWASEYNHLDVVMWLYKNYKWPRAEIAEAMEVAATYGNLEILKWLYTESLNPGKMRQFLSNIPGISTMLSALSALSALPSNPHLLNTNSMDWAAKNGHLDIVKWLHENSTEGCTKRAMDMAAEEGHLHIVKWLHKNRTEGCTTAAMDAAATHGHLYILEWLYRNRTEGCTTWAMSGAAKNGHIDVIKWLHLNKYDVVQDSGRHVLNAAAGYGHLNVIKWVYDNNYIDIKLLSLDIIAKAAQYGHIHVVEWLHSYYIGVGCRYPKITDTDDSSNYGIILALDSAAEKGYLYMLQWITKHIEIDGALFASSALLSAITYNHFTIVKWLHQNWQASIPKNIIHQHERRFHNECEHIIKWLRENGYD